MEIASLMVEVAKQINPSMMDRDELAYLLALFWRTDFQTGEIGFHIDPKTCIDEALVAMGQHLITRGAGNNIPKLEVWKSMCTDLPVQCRIQHFSGDLNKQSKQALSHSSSLPLVRIYHASLEFLRIVDAGELIQERLGYRSGGLCGWRCDLVWPVFFLRFYLLKTKSRLRRFLGALGQALPFQRSSKWRELPRKCNGVAKHELPNRKAQLRLGWPPASGNSQSSPILRSYLEVEQE